jgi:hypothetical protein
MALSLGTIFDGLRVMSGIHRVKGVVVVAVDASHGSRASSLRTP